MKKFWQKNQKGGTLLINLLASLSILVLLMALSIPNIRKYQPNLKLSATAREMVTNMRFAQQLTVTGQVVHQVEIDFTNSFYSIIKTGIATSTIKTIYFDPEINFQQITGLTDDTVEFNSYGGVSESGQIILINTNGKISVINVKPSGYIQLVQ